MQVFVCDYTPDLNYTLIPHMVSEIHAATKERFPTTVLHRFRRDEKQDFQFFQHLYKLHKQQQPFLLIDINGVQSFIFKGEDFVPNRLSFFTDGPFTILKRLKGLQATTCMSYSDRTHDRVLDDFGIGNPKFFLPHFGASPTDNPLPMAERDIGLLFVGQVRAPRPTGSFSSIFGASTDEKWIKIFDQAGEQAQFENTAPYDAVMAACDDFDMEPFKTLGDDQFAELLSHFSSWVEFQNRNRLLKSMAGLGLHIVGPAFDEVKGITDADFTFHGLQKAAGVLDFLGRSRVLLNSISVFPEGSHERLWHGAAAGTVLATDRSRYLEEYFKDGQDIAYLDYRDNSQAERLDDLAQDIGRLQSMSDNSSRIYAAHHTPRHRMQTAFDFLEQQGRLDHQ